MNSTVNKSNGDDLKHLKKKSNILLSEELPPGWTAHLAPTGHLYYFHKATRKSTYIRPSVDTPAAAAQVIVPPPPPLPSPPIQSDQLVTGSSFPNVSGIPEQLSFLSRFSREKVQDRPKYRSVHMTCAHCSCFQVTRRRRQFVHNLETGVSLWVPPEEVLLAMHEEEKNNNPLNSLFGYSEQSSSEYDSSDFTLDSDDASDASNPNVSANASHDAFFTTLDNTEYTEDDIAWQLAAMENNDFGAAPAQELSKDEKIKQFKEMLHELDINPYHPWDQEVSKIMMDPRYLLIDTMKERKELFEAFCKESVAQQKKEAESKPKRNPKISFIALLQDPQTPNMYWHEFRRKFRKEQEYKEFGLNDKEREKLFRAYQER
ncbi:unnamed protein product, partial [Pneumocystis jirovecii]